MLHVQGHNAPLDQGIVFYFEEGAGCFYWDQVGFVLADYLEFVVVIGVLLAGEVNLEFFG